ncbi:PREDICTED: uncharacterized protein LOC109393720 isoform X2 [Hipposideros armiger]|uniref:Uncharacterized protein LOC109393720 isoform X2 n=1 Tax=Hipposideros armiger TaxID=186990 RepID=A0A8B7SZE2_HIPAR|nr:PREDICTED: uncharacterized protein LOC109393720 isoform X2 [Hipposideros armiger]XP_019518766.1 PREDICTED: uncharacterized protein LOC109393720 isoform X2 [Hipposideros armiger]
MSAAAWAAGSAVARPWRGRRRRWRRPGKEEEKRKERRRRRGAPASRPQQLVRLRYFQRQAEGAEVGSARPESLNWEEKEKEAGKMPLARAGRTAAPRPRCCNPRRLLFRPLGLHHANSRESEAHPLRPSGCGPRVPHVLDTFAAPDYTPRVRWGHQAHRGLSTGLVGCGRARRVASQRSGKKWASAPGCQGSAVRHGIATGILPTVSQCRAKHDERIWSQRVETFVFPQKKYSGPPKISLSFRPIQHQGNRQISTENTKVYNYALSSLSKLRVFKQLRRG